MDIDALAALAGNALVTAAVTDAFEDVRHKVARLFGRGKPDDAARRRLDATRESLTAAAPADLDRAREVQARQWETRFADLLADYPEAAGELRALVDGMRAAMPESGGNVTNTISGTVHGTAVMGRDFGDITIGTPPPAAEK